jgi:hypothetical protein
MADDDCRAIVREIAEGDPLVIEEMGEHRRVHCRYCEGAVDRRVYPGPERWIIAHHFRCLYVRACALVGAEMMHRE